MIVILLVGGLYLGRMMQQMVGYMSAMNEHTVSMAQTLDSMSVDIKTMAQQTEGIHAGISAIDQHISKMSGDIRNMTVEMYGMHHETAGIDQQIAQLNADMSNIQNVMSADLSSMRQGVDSMSYDVRYMRNSLLQMSTDIRNGSEAFTSPQHYFQNMFDYGR